MRPTRRPALLALALVAACSRPGAAPEVARGPEPGATPEVRRLIEDHARTNGVPAELVDRVVRHESGYRPSARNGPYYGLMQIHPRTAATMGYAGPPEGLLDADTNLRYGVRYLRGAWLVAGGSQDRAVEWYRRGYYYEARRLGLLEETGLRR